MSSFVIHTQTGLDYAFRENATYHDGLLIFNAAGPNMATAIANKINQILLRNLPITKIELNNSFEMSLGSLGVPRFTSDDEQNQHKLGDVNAIGIAVGLATNKTLKTLAIVDNNIGDYGANALFKALATNDSLEVLDLSNNLIQLSHNRITQRDSVSLPDVLAANTTLTTLKLKKNGLRPDNIRALIASLQKNFTLISLDDICDQEYIHIPEHEAQPIRQSIDLLTERNKRIASSIQIEIDEINKPGATTNLTNTTKSLLELNRALDGANKEAREAGRPDGYPKTSAIYKKAEHTLRYLENVKDLYLALKEKDTEHMSAAIENMLAIPADDIFFNNAQNVLLEYAITLFKEPIYIENEAAPGEAAKQTVDTETAEKPVFLDTAEKRQQRLAHYTENAEAKRLARLDRIESCVQILSAINPSNVKVVSVISFFENVRTLWSVLPQSEPSEDVRAALSHLYKIKPTDHYYQYDLVQNELFEYANALFTQRPKEESDLQHAQRLSACIGILDKIASNANVMSLLSNVTAEDLMINLKQLPTNESNDVQIYRLMSYFKELDNVNDNNAMKQMLATQIADKLVACVHTCLNLSDDDPNKQRGLDELKASFEKLNPDLNETRYLKQRIEEVLRPANRSLFTQKKS